MWPHLLLPLGHPVLRFCKSKRAADARPSKIPSKNKNIWTNSCWIVVNPLGGFFSRGMPLAAGDSLSRCLRLGGMPRWIWTIGSLWLFMPCSSCCVQTRPCVWIKSLQSETWKRNNQANEMATSEDGAWPLLCLHGLWLAARNTV